MGRRHTVTMRMTLLRTLLMRQVWALRHQTGAQYPNGECTTERAATRSVLTLAARSYSASFFYSVINSSNYLLSFCLRWFQISPRHKILLETLFFSFQSFTFSFPPFSFRSSLSCVSGITLVTFDHHFWGCIANCNLSAYLWKDRLHK